MMQAEALFKLGYGVYIISSFEGEKLNGQIATVCFQVTAKPAQIVICLNKENLTHDLVMKSRLFGVSVLDEDSTMLFIGQFGFKSGRVIDKFNGTKYRVSPSGIPLVLDHAVAVLEARVLQSLDVGTHTLFVGEVTDCEVLTDAHPMTYEYYHQVKKGKSPKTAPTYVAPAGT
jgi:ferric-chelate reductase [NAD(P)H]